MEPMDRKMARTVTLRIAERAFVEKGVGARLTRELLHRLALTKFDANDMSRVRPGSFGNQPSQKPNHESRAENAKKEHRNFRWIV
jgi:hypothetical protein